MKIDISSWGEQPPEFIRVLATTVEKTGTRKAAGDLIGIDRASVSTLLSNTYPANTAEMEKKILAFGSGKRCPVLGQISGDECQKKREQTFISSNPQRVALYRACSKCEHNPMRGEV